MLEVNRRALIEYLKYHEYDIGDDINDFGDLKDLFYDLFGRNARSN